MLFNMKLVKIILFIMLAPIILLARGVSSAELAVEEPQSIRIGEERFALLFDKHKPTLLLMDIVNHKKILELLDRDNDGKPDMLRYSSFDESGVELVESTDCELDGQIDVRWHYPYIVDLSYIEVWYDEKWNKINKGSFIEVNGKQLRVVRSNGCYEVQPVIKGDGGN